MHTRVYILIQAMLKGGIYISKEGELYGKHTGKRFL